MKNYLWLIAVVVVLLLVFYRRKRKRVPIIGPSRKPDKLLENIDIEKSISEFTGPFPAAAPPQ